MAYFNYHATAKKLIEQGKLKDYYFTQRHNSISPALVLVFDDIKHPLMPIRQHKWGEYIMLIDKHST
ncbi:MAG: thermostable hemolysin delta-VPH [Clostridiales bacterium]|nr:thermostable hemolysin delta-VPH [Clostridiales bacterium]